MSCWRPLIGMKPATLVWEVIYSVVWMHVSMRILRHPECYPVVHRETRMGIVRRFPYLLLYRVAKETVFVVAVFHAKRDPEIWKAR